MGSPVREFDVVIPAYNASATVASAVRSARRAGAANVIVVNDGSSDGTRQEAVSAGATVIDQMNSGAALARRNGLRHVESECVVLLDADDQLVASGVEKSLELLGADASLVAAGGAVVFRSSGRDVSVLRHARPEMTTRRLLENGFSPAPPCAFVWSRRALASALESPLPGLWPRYAEDFEMVIRASLEGGIRLHSEVAAIYAAEGGKSSVVPMRSIESSEAIRQHYADLLGIPLRQRSKRALEARVILRGLQSGPPKNQHKFLALVSAATKDPALLCRLAAGRLARVLS